MTVLGVHGIFNSKILKKEGSAEGAARALGAEWTKALTRGRAKYTPTQPPPSPATVVFYSDLLLPQVTSMAGDPFEQLSDDAKDVFQALVEEFARAQELGLEAELVPQNLAHTVLLRYPLEFVRKLLGERGVGVVAWVSEEIAQYFAEDHTRRMAVRDRIAESIRRERPTVLLAHSLGSVAVYEALCAEPELGEGIELLVTLGSPLAVPRIIFDRLDPAPRGKAMRPPNVGRWINVADIGDPVAVPRRGVERSFEGLDEQVTVSINAVNPHGVSGYLGCRHLITRLADYVL